MFDSADAEDGNPDHYNAVYFNMFYQGVSTALPWNVLIFAHDYFKERLRHVPQAENFLLYFVLFFMTMKFVFLVSGIKFTSFVSTDHQITWSIATNTLVFLLLSISSIVHFSHLPSYYYLLLALVLLAALFSAFTEAGFLAILAHFPPRYTQSYLVGHGFAGVITALLHMCTALGTASAVSRAFAEMYFGFATAVVLSSLLLYRYMQGLDMFQYHYQRGQSSLRAKREEDRLAKETGMRPGTYSTTLQILRQILDLFVTVFAITWLNVLISPMLVFMTQPRQLMGVGIFAADQGFFHVFALLLASISDLLGRCLPYFSSLALTRMPFLLIASLRLLLLPLLLAGNIRLEHYSLPFSPLYANDYVFFTIVALKAFTGGYLGTLCMMWSPFRVKPMDRGRGVTLMVYSMGLGLLLGAISAFGLKHLLTAISIKT